MDNIHWEDLGMTQDQAKRAGYTKDDFEELAQEYYAQLAAEEDEYNQTIWNKDRYDG